VVFDALFDATYFQITQGSLSSHSTFPRVIKPASSVGILLLVQQSTEQYGGRQQRYQQRHHLETAWHHETFLAAAIEERCRQTTASEI
jgi:hypothetical protein